MTHVSSKSPQDVLSFNIQMISGKNVVLVSCEDYEMELFMPQIVRGRISFQNIIPNRQCCVESKKPRPFPFKGAFIESGGKTAGSPGIQQLTCTPIAQSTPSGFSMQSQTKGGKENISPPPAEIMTPDLLRCKPAESDFSIPEDLNIFQHNPEEIFSSCDVELPHKFSYRQKDLDPGSIMSTPARSSYSVAIEPRISSVLRHVRTYSRRKSNTMSKSTIICSPLQKKKIISSKVSTTNGPQAPMKLEIRHRKLIVDNPKSLDTLSINKLSSFITKKRIMHNQVTAKTRKQFEALKTTAFDLITMPSHKHVSRALNDQFQLACVDKIATTLRNYAQLASTKPLDIDREVKTMISKHKRLKKTYSKPTRVYIE
ncbi:uncharacterized protein Dwil_GK19221 [Drosophila willistoni]|uniref:Uncharacterized protein n=1 Tax=Drosophila willistoni TaxID=7260 RepID=B4NMJ6_DROWI|nr:uncharacterized protein LOC6652415 [Drosophila willistoni]EDW85585.1 uncharacterized protein Dwil_GK19221 [Drosophila willistoni]